MRPAVIDAPSEPARPAVFVSHAHPRGRAAGWVYAEALVRPLAACTLPVMILTLMAALEGAALWGFLLVGFPLAFLAASSWTLFQLLVTPAEVHVAREAAALQTVGDVLWRPGRLSWQPVLDLRLSEHALSATLGDVPFEATRTDWPAFDELLHHLTRARHALA